MASGTRGDVQPMTALGQGLQAAGHRVRMIALLWMGWLFAQMIGHIDHDHIFKATQQH